MSKKVIIITSHFSPNVGGVETHLNDLVAALTKRDWKVLVSTYIPLARNAKVKLFEERRNFKIYRMPWIGFNIVHRLTNYPSLEFIYLFPGLFIGTLFTLIKNTDVEVLHAQGLVPAVVGLILGKIFRKKVIASTHNLYFFPKKSLYTSFSKLILSSIDKNLCLSNQSLEELASIGVPRSKLAPFRYWLDLNLFKPSNKNVARKKLNLPKTFTVFFVGRLIETKGVKVILEASKKVKNVRFIFAGLGPLASELENYQSKNKDILYVGALKPDEVKLYMSAADIVVVPSLVDEGYGRVAMEAIACGTPVLAADKGGLNEVVDKKVGILIKPDGNTYAKWINNLKKNTKVLVNLSRNTRKYATQNFSDKNVEQITSEYSR